MTKQAIIEKTLKALNQPPDEKAREVFDFADFIVKRHEEALLNKGIQLLTADTSSFSFLNEEEEIYSLSNLKKIYNG
jgi:hypothetical protein